MSFALVDCNNFFVSCEQMFNPRLRNRPLVVLSNNDGCVVSRSQEAKRIGIPMGAPYFEYKDALRKHGGVACSGNFALYGDMSHRVMETIIEECPEMEIYSIDEAFLEVSSFQEPEEFAQRLRSKIQKWTGIPVSIGIGSTKTRAKLANEYAKNFDRHSGVCDLEIKKSPDDIMQSIAVDDVWGIGRSYAQLLAKNKIYTALDLKKADVRWIKRQMGKLGVHIVLELDGMTCIELDDAPAPKKSITTSRTFGRPVREYKELEQAVATFIARAAEKLRGDKACAKRVHVYIRSSLFDDSGSYNASASLVLDEATQYTPELIQTAHRILKRLYREGVRYKKAGVIFTELVPEDAVQISMNSFFSSMMAQDESNGGGNPAWHDYQTKQKRLMNALDSLNLRFGSGMLRYAAEPTRKPWGMSQSLKTPAYTTRWEDIPIVRASFT